MELTKYPQSCIVVSKAGKRLLVDYGKVASPHYSLQTIGPVDAALYTHSHVDHLDVEAAEELLASGVPVYGNAGVQQAIRKDINQIKDGDGFEVAGFTIKVVDMPHCLWIDGKEMDVVNSALLIDDSLLLPGDSTMPPAGLAARVVAAPIWGPDITLRDAHSLALAVKADVVIPVHYDVASLNPTVADKLGGFSEFEYRVVDNGETTSI